MDKRIYRYSVCYDFTPKPMVFPKTEEEILRALYNFKGDVEHHLLDPRAVATVSEPLPDKSMAVIIETTASPEEVEEAIKASCVGLGLCARRVGSTGIP